MIYTFSAQFVLQETGERLTSLLILDLRLECTAALIERFNSPSCIKDIRTNESPRRL
jgi:hypothetical protein